MGGLGEDEMNKCGRNVRTRDGCRMEKKEYKRKKKMKVKKLTYLYIYIIK
jgi:hypothetical protein